MIYLFNTTIIPNPGTFHMSEISAEEARDICAEGFTSAIGHEATAVAFTEILGKPVKVNRIAVELLCDKAVCLKLKGRLPEGVILSLSDLEKIGYKLFLIERID